MQAVPEVGMGQGLEPAASARALVFLVEDDLPLARTLAAHLEGRGYGVLVAGSCREAEALAAQARPDVLLLDLGLPDGSGWDFLRLFRQRLGGWQVPVIVITSRVVSRQELLAWQVEVGLLKPFSVERLLEALRQALERSGRGGEW